MALEQYAYIAEIVGVLVVTASLLYLAKQVRQNSKQLESQSYQAWVDSNVQINMSMADPELSAIVAKGHFDTTKLTDETYVAYAMSHLAMLQMAQAADYLYRSGSLDRELWEGEMNRAAGILAIPGVRQWWDAGGNTQLTEGFVERLEATQSSIAYWTWDSERGFYRTEDIVEEASKFGQSDAN
jgi:hypothetical protein